MNNVCIKLIQIILEIPKMYFSTYLVFSTVHFAKNRIKTIWVPILDAKIDTSQLDITN